MIFRRVRIGDKNGVLAEAGAFRHGGAPRPADDQIRRRIEVKHLVGTFQKEFFPFEGPVGSLELFHLALSRKMDELEFFRPGEGKKGKDRLVQRGRSQRAAEGQKHGMGGIELRPVLFVDLCQSLRLGTGGIFELASQRHSGENGGTQTLFRIRRGEGEGQSPRIPGKEFVGLPQPGVAVVQEDGDMQFFRGEGGRKGGKGPHAQQGLRPLFAESLHGGASPGKKVEEEPHGRQGTHSGSGGLHLNVGDLIGIGDFALFRSVFSSDDEKHVPALFLEFPCHGKSGIEVSARAAAADRQMFQFHTFLFFSGRATFPLPFLFPARRADAP